MKIKGKIIDLNSKENVNEFDVVSFKSTDVSRGAIKGHTGTVIDLTHFEKYGYQIETDSGNCHFFKREEFRLATLEDITRLREMRAITKARAIKRDTPVNIPDIPVAMYNYLDNDKKII